MEEGSTETAQPGEAVIIAAMVAPAPAAVVVLVLGAATTATTGPRSAVANSAAAAAAAAAAERKRADTRAALPVQLGVPLREKATLLDSVQASFQIHPAVSSAAASHSVRIGNITQHVLFFTHMHTHMGSTETLGEGKLNSRQSPETTNGCCVMASGSGLPVDESDLVVGRDSRRTSAVKGRPAQEMREGVSEQSLSGTRASALSPQTAQE